MKFIKLILFLTGVFFMVGGACPSNETTLSNKVAQSEIYQSYVVRENGQMYEITAFFRIGGETGTTLALSSPSKVSFNGQQLSENLNTSGGTYYSLSIPNSTTVGNFEFIDRKGKVYKNRIDLKKISIPTKSISANDQSIVEIPLSQNVPESTGLNLQISTRGESHSVFVGSIFDASLNQTNNRIAVKPAVWKEIPSGNGQIRLSVTHNLPTQQGTNLGGKMSFIYESLPITYALKKTQPLKNTTAKRKVR